MELVRVMFSLGFGYGYVLGSNSTADIFCMSCLAAFASCHNDYINFEFQNLLNIFTSNWKLLLMSEFNGLLSE